MADFYAVLGIQKGCPDADFEAVLRKAYYSLARTHHPDKCGGSQEATEKFKEIQIAYETLKDPLKRKRYDERQAPRCPASAQSASTSKTQPPPPWPRYDFPSYEDIEEEFTIHLAAIQKNYHLYAKDLADLDFWTVPSKSFYTDHTGKQVRCPDAHIYWETDVRQRAIELHGGTWEAHETYVKKMAARAKKSKETKERNKLARERGIEIPDMPTPKKKREPRPTNTPKSNAGQSVLHVTNGILSPPATPPRPSNKKTRKRKADDEDYHPSSVAATVDSHFPSTPRSLRPRRTTAHLADPPSPPGTPSPPSKKRRGDPPSEESEAI